MKECLYCKKTIKKNETEHFTCEVCGAAMCHDCYDLDTEHNNHYHARTLTIFNIKTLKRVPGDYICTDCIAKGDILLLDEKRREDIIKLWEYFSEISVDDNDEIEQDFYEWEKGTDKYYIWSWFDEQFEEGLGKYLENKGEN